MVGDGVLTLRTGPGGSGKSYWVVKWIMEELLPYYKDSRVMTNLPLLSKDPRIELRDFPKGWQPTLEECEGCTVVVDEAHTVFTRENDATFRAVLGKARHYNTRWVLLSQSKDKLPGWVDEEAEIWFESANGRSLRDQTFGFRLYDLQNVWAKLTGHFQEFFKLTEYVRSNRRWKAIQTYNEWFNKTVGEWYNTKNKDGARDNGEAEVVHDYMRFSWPVLLTLVMRRNWHVMPMFLMKNGAPIAFVGVGLGWIGWMWLRNPASVVVQKSDVPSRVSVVVPAAVSGEASVVKPVASGRVLTWAFLLCAFLCGCRGPTSRMLPAPPEEHVGRELAAVVPSPRVALLGSGHSLDAALKQAGIESHTGELVDGPLVGREVIQAARRFGFELDPAGRKMIPVERRAVPVPHELGEYVKDVTAQVGGYPVTLATVGEVDEWKRLADVVHECYAIDLLICSVSDNQSRNLGLVTSGTGSVDVGYPGKTKFGGRANVRLSVDGSVVLAREVARPVLHAAHDAETDLHVGSKVPIRTTQTSTDGQTRSVGGLISYVSTGIEVRLKPSRVSTTQIRLTGMVSVSDQTSVSDGVPVTTERRVSVDQLLTLGQFGAVARLDRVVETSSGAWFGLGGLRHAGSETFVVLVCPRQISKQRDRPLPVASLPDSAPVNFVERLEGGPRIEAVASRASAPSVSPPGQVPPGQVPPGQVPPGQVPPGQVPPGQVPVPGQGAVLPPGPVSGVPVRTKITSSVGPSADARGPAKPVMPQSSAPVGAR